MQLGLVSIKYLLDAVVQNGIDAQNLFTFSVCSKNFPVVVFIDVKNRSCQFKKKSIIKFN